MNPALLTDSLHGGFSYKPPYEAIRNFYKARYYAQKAHDLSTLQSKIYGLGNGFYGFRYGSNFAKPQTFAKYFGPAYRPSGIAPQNLYLQSLISSPVKGLPLNNFYIPKNYGNSYSKNYAYGKGYSYNSYNTQNIIPTKQFSYWNPGYNFQQLPVDYKVPLVPVENSYVPGYQYSYFIKGPTFPMFDVQIPNKGYDSIYGTRYSGFPNQIPAWKSKVPEWQSYPMSITPAFKGYDSIYGTRYGGFPNQVPEWETKVPEWYSNLMAMKSTVKEYGWENSGFPIKKETGLYESNYGGPVDISGLNKQGTSLYSPNIGPLDTKLLSPKSTDLLYNSNYGAGNPSIKATGAYGGNYKAVNTGIIHKNLVPVGATFNGPPPSFGNIEPKNLVPYSGADFQVEPGHYELYSNLPKDLLVPSDDDFLSDHPDLTVLGSVAESAKVLHATSHKTIKRRAIEKGQ